ncbi:MULTISPECIES: hypothetical protein [unclassified Streptomyces]|uniref:hypothetical protein n=1 Tax=unclassified Streptomyces TaxID=2593676 RepID=UPI002E284158|nr:hypothetical protein [Streptomyces sp. NBC_01453]
MNRPDGKRDSQPRSTSRFAFDRTPSIFAGTNSSPSRTVISFTDNPSPSPASSVSSNATIL